MGPEIDTRKPSLEKQLISPPSGSTRRDQQEPQGNETNEWNQKSNTKALKTKFVLGTITHKKYSRTCMLNLNRMTAC